MNLIIIPI